MKRFFSLTGLLTFKSFGTGDDFEDFGGNCGLSDSVCGEGKFADHFSCVIGGG